MPGMPSSSPLEAPTEWPAESRGRFVLAFALLVGLGVVSIGVGAVAVTGGIGGATKYAVLFAGLFWFAAAFGYLTRIRPPHRTTDIGTTAINGHRATEIKYSGAQFALINSLMVCLFLCAAFAAWDYGHAGSGAFVPGIPMFLAVAAGLFIASFFAFVGLGRLRRGRILIATDGIHQEGRAFESFLPWDSFADIKPSYNGTREVLVVAYSNAAWQKRQLTGLWKLDKLPPVPMIEINTVHLAIDPTLVYHLVRFYTENPSTRDELGTDTALRRLQERNF